ncbi:hypothetical protein Lser_V15G01820 [Lactuca serriola]
MQWKSPADAMPWVGLYVCLASLVCTLAMAADAFQCFWQWKLWFPCRFFTINAASITLIAIAIKLPVDLDTDMSDTVYMIAKSASIIFLVTMVANFLPSLGLIDDKELLMNMLAFGILIITSSVNVWIQFSTIGPFTTPIQLLILILPLPWPFSVAMIVPASRRSLQHHYEKLHGLASDPQEINFSGKRLIRYVKEYWMMAEIGNSQFVIACSPVSSTFGIINNVEEYSAYVIQIEADTKLSKRILRRTLNSIIRLLHEDEEKEPRNLTKLLKKSTGFYGVVEFDNDQVPRLHQEEMQNCWSLVTVTLTAIALALPKIAKCHVKGLLAGMREGLEFVTHIEESLNENGDYVKARKAARRVWTNVELYCRWLQIDLQKKAPKGKTSKEILQWLGDEAAKVVIQFKTRKNLSIDHSLRKFIAASSMYKISQTVLLHCSEQESWPIDEELFEFISTINRRSAMCLLYQLATCHNYEVS